MCAEGIAMLKFLSASLLITGCVASVDESSTLQASQIDYPGNVPASLAPAADQRLAFAFDAIGVQKYECRTTGWFFTAPDARLYRGKNDVGHHFAGPTWEYQDGSTVVGAKVAGATVDATAIPWLLLKSTGHGDVDGKMTEVTSIQRLQTVGGLAPATGCDADHLGALADVPYTATYYFFRTQLPDSDE
jgi:FtsP/CotA-like multicopper oxidase with cupredoxin domain